MIRRALFVLLLLGLPLGSVQAYERITRFVSEVEVQTNGDLLVTEVITVDAELRDIRRGILRDFPTTYQLPDGRRVVVGFDVLSVTRGGAAERFVTESLANGVRIRIGNGSVLLTRGEHTYVIKYRTTRQVGFLADYDEIYWNVTGTGWTFDIDYVEAWITLPQGAKIASTSFYTGAQGEKGKDAAVGEQRNTFVIFRTTKRLPAKNGLTVSVTWQKGIVAPPSEQLKAWYFVTDNSAQSLSLIGLALVVFYFFYQWLRYGRDPAPGTVIPVFEPPSGMSAAGMRYVDKGASFDDKALTAAIVELGVKGHLQLKEEKGVTRLEKRDGGKPLLDGEDALMRHLFPKKSKTLELSKTNHEKIALARGALKLNVERLFGDVWRSNYGKWGLGLLLTFIAVVLTLTGIAISFSTAYVTEAFIGTLLPIVPLLLASFALNNGFAARTDKGFLISVGVLCGILPALGLWYVWRNVSGIYELIPTICAFSATMLCAFFLEWMEAPTKRGRQYLDHIEGLRDYMGTADEERRLEVLNPPEKTPELFERMLPYAIALDLENSWAKKFAAVLAAAAAVPAAAATGAAISQWYSGNRDWGNDPAGLTNTISSSATPVYVSSSSSSPGSSGGSSYSSSGSSDSGSSGGGGGGGGGSGW